MPHILAPSRMKNRTSSSDPAAHLAKRLAKRLRSLANSSSRSKRSSAGGAARAAPGERPRAAAAAAASRNCGAMRLSGAFFTPNLPYSSAASGTRFVSIWYIVSSKSAVKSFGRSSVSLSGTRAVGRERLRVRKVCAYSLTSSTRQRPGHTVSIRRGWAEPSQHEVHDLRVILAVEPLVVRHRSGAEHGDATVALPARLVPAPERGQGLRVRVTDLA